MASRLEIDHASISDKDLAGHVEFSGELDGEERDFAVKHAVLKECSGDDPEDDALELFERFEDEIAEACIEAARRQSDAAVVTVDVRDLK